MHRFFNELVLTFTTKLVRNINTKTLVNTTVGVFGLSVYACMSYRFQDIQRQIMA